ncbi:MAG: GNAT family N-acetyltransferase [Desulfobulbus sp.]|jgi:GNAT superfamily N-acetyltransferase|uniref:GNAT family N-acetyltransferase n=1 Tax=Desulfobulbus sp. TaxID=895 RepID=UPI002841FE5B|nr:GNAT family N-acetyltransferase [Desulfobulbus sp.]MDR2550538.1 GNAT family N-acetyltransferase [Desulfobulbus sp.]
MDIRKAQKGDLGQILELYTQLHGNDIPPFDKQLEILWRDILEDKHHYILVGVSEQKIISSCVVLVIPNLTHNQRSYALIENVVTHEAHRNKGYATQLLNFAREIATEQRCYKIMLMTGSKQESTWRFYERAGYNAADKKAFIQWIE